MGRFYKVVYLNAICRISCRDIPGTSEPRERNFYQKNIVRISFLHKSEDGRYYQKVMNAKNRILRFSEK